MKNINLLLECNKIGSSKIKLEKNCILIKIRNADQFFTGKTIKFIAEKLNAIHKQYKRMKIPIVFDFGSVEFIDKLTFVIFECICYDLIVNYGHHIQVYMNVNIQDNVHTAGIASSPLLLLNGTNIKSVKKYPDKFKMDLYRSHFRRMVQGTTREETNYLGRLYEEIDSFLKPFDIEEVSRDKVANVISELVGNGCEHGDGDCLIDIDVAPNYTKMVENIPDGHKYYGINIAVVNFSRTLLGDGIYKNVLNGQQNQYSERYKTVIEAFQNHRQFFNQDYLIEDFCNITAFQHKISGRGDNNPTGGTGLTKLIQSLEERSDAYRCYVVSGRRAVNFYKELLEYNSDNWLGFNEEKDYISNIPSKKCPEREVLSDSLMYFPGTAYNLNFVMKVNEEWHGK